MLVAILLFSYVEKLAQGKNYLLEQSITLHLVAIISFSLSTAQLFPDTLLESELFGYEEGTFTGANKGGKLGLFELASGGTLFLDEIGDISSTLQAKLLRVLQEHRVRRIGGNREIPINVRIISATNCNLEQMVKDGLFRQDLYYRLNVIPLYLPPLRERKEDIRLLANYSFSIHSK